MLLSDVKIVVFGVLQVANHCTPMVALGQNQRFFTDFNEVREVHTGTGKKEMESKNHDFIGKYRNTGRADRGTG